MARDSASSGVVHQGIEGMRDWRYDVKIVEISAVTVGRPQCVRASLG